MYKKILKLIKNRLNPFLLHEKPNVQKQPIGNHHQLQQIFDSLNQIYFEGSLKIQIKWFGDQTFKHRSRIILGSYHQSKKLIKIHRVLDQPHIPHYFISYIVYHEMLHHVYPPICLFRQNRKIHHADFKREEKKFASYKEAQNFRKTIQKSWFLQNINYKLRR